MRDAATVTPFVAMDDDLAPLVVELDDVDVVARHVLVRPSITNPCCASGPMRNG
jgi:hypothetical protein